MTFKTNTELRAPLNEEAVVSGVIEQLKASGLIHTTPPQAAQTSPVALGASTSSASGIELRDEPYILENKALARIATRSVRPNKGESMELALERAQRKADLTAIVLATAVASQRKCRPEEVLRDNFTGSNNGGLGLKALADVVERSFQVAKSISGVLSGVEFSNGGAWVPVEFLSGYVDVLTAEPSVLTAEGIVRFLINTTDATLPKLTSATSATYLGPGQQPTITVPGTGAMNWRLRRLAGGAVVNNRFISSVTSFDAAAIIANRLLRDFYLKQNLQVLRGEASEYAPNSLRGMCPSTHLVAFTGTETDYDDTYAWLSAIQGKSEDANVPMDGWYWVLSGKLKRRLWSLIRTNGDSHPFKNEMVEQGTLMGDRFIVSNQQPNTLGVGGDETEITRFRAPSLHIAEGPLMRLRMSTEAAYQDSNGNTRSAFMGDETVMVAEGWHDFQLDHDQAAAVGTTYQPGTI